jgi:hypothetical protein
MPRLFAVISEIDHVEIIAREPGIRIRRWLNETFGVGRWRKLKGIAVIEYTNGKIGWPKCIGLRQMESVVDVKQ